ncbi:MAG: cytidine deaminase, partial [Syntrophomonadaceae bacterium]
MFDTRPSWNDYFLEVADLVATRSTCLRRQVGAV